MKINAIESNYIFNTAKRLKFIYLHVLKHCHLKLTFKKCTVNISFHYVRFLSIIKMQSIPKLFKALARSLCV